MHLTQPLQRKLLSVALSLLALSAPASKACAEGSKQLMQDTSSRAALCTGGTDFATRKSTDNPETRLQIHIANPGTEQVYLGFSKGYSTGSSNILGEGSPSTSTYYFRIKDPAGNVVFGPQAIDASNAIPPNVLGFNQVQAGPVGLGNAGGYSGFTYTPLPGATAGDYYIEFNKLTTFTNDDQISFDYWDITVGSASTNTAKPGRIWSKRWGFYSKDYVISGTSTPIQYSGQFKGQLYTYTDEGVVEKVDFSNGGFRGGNFLVAMNGTGPGRTGNYIADRKSVHNASLFGVGYKIFLSDPDIAIYPTGSSQNPTFAFGNPAVTCGATSVNLDYTLSRAGVTQFVLDFNNNGIFDPQTRDVQLAQVSTAGDNNLVWNRRDGLGNIVNNADLAAIRILAQYQLGVHHMSLSDIEYMNNGFTATQIRPVFIPGLEDKFYWDDSIIKATNPGLQDPYTTGPQPAVVNLAGLPVRKWDNFTNNATLGFGNKNSINTWWNLYELDKIRFFNVAPCLGMFDVSGTVWNDANGDGLKQVTEPYLAVAKAGEKLYAVLIQTSNTASGEPTIYNSAPVTANATGYSINSVAAGNGYQVRIVSLPEAPLNGAFASTLMPALANGYVGVSTNSNGTAAGNKNTNNLVINLPAFSGSVASVNFGIEQLPFAQSFNTTIPTPAGNQFTTLDGMGSNPPVFEGSDPEDQPLKASLSGKKIAITSLPAASELYYNGTRITVGHDGINPPSVANSFPIPGAFDPSKMQVKFRGEGSTSLEFGYTYIDAAGIPAATPATYILGWPTPLPIGLLSFEASSKDNCEIALKWTTTPQSTATSYTIKRSTNGTDWTEIGTQSAGSTAENSYPFTDKMPAEGRNYYRLRVTLQNGTVEYSPTTSARNKCVANPIVIYPNPVREELKVEGITTGIEIHLLDIQGKVLLAHKANGATATLNLSGLVPGSYQVVVTDAAGRSLFAGHIIKVAD